jgi:hypothetical protein
MGRRTLGFENLISTSKELRYEYYRFSDYTIWNSGFHLRSELFYIAPLKKLNPKIEVAVEISTLASMEARIR